MLSLLGLFLLLSSAAGKFPHSGSASSSMNPSISDGLRVSGIRRDGEFERVTAWPGFCAKETSVKWGGIDVTLREVWLKEEKRKLQLIYEGGILSDCFDVRIEFTGAEEGNDDVTKECLSELSSAKLHRLKEKSEEEEADTDNNAVVPTRTDFSPQSGANWFVSVDELRNRCIRVKNRTRNQVLARHGQSLRVRRGILEDFLFAPGTKWCGPTQLASRYNELGAFDQLDRCCRRHDHCHRAIPPMTRRYGFFNHMPFTLSHCGCDQSFRTCLKMAGTSSANFVGKLFFNVVQTKCFVLKPRKSCLQRSWWGECERHEYRKQAHLRDNVPY